MDRRKLPNLVLALVVIASLLVGAIGTTSAAVPAPDVAVSAFEREATLQGERVAAAAPTVPTDESKVPHYFGPNPNWALSPFTLPAVTVTINGVGGGSGATAVATVGANGAVTGITITNPGSGYTAATVAITGLGSGATADAVVVTSGIVTGITLNAPAGGYTAPIVTIGSVVTGGASEQATATVSGNVENTIAIISGGVGYTNPTVEFDMPSDPNGTIAQGSAILDGSGAVTGITVTDPGSGYSTAPGVNVLNGTRFDPIPCGGGAAAQAVRAETMQSNDPGTLAPESSAAVETDSAGITAAALRSLRLMAGAVGCGAVARATLAIQGFTLDTFGVGYTSQPDVLIAEDPLHVPLGTGTGATATATVDAGGVTGIINLVGGSGYITGGGIKKFVDPLPGLCVPGVNCPDWAANPAAKAIPVGVAAKIKYPIGDPNGIEADQYEIGLVQYRSSFSSSLPPSLVRGYVQLAGQAPSAAGTSPSSTRT